MGGRWGGERGSRAQGQRVPGPPRTGSSWGRPVPSRRVSLAALGRPGAAGSHRLRVPALLSTAPSVSPGTERPLFHECVLSAEQFFAQNFLPDFSCFHFFLFLKEMQKHDFCGKGGLCKNENLTNLPVCGSSARP